MFEQSVNLIVVTKSQFIRIKTEEHVYIGRRRTTSFNETDTCVSRNCKYNASIYTRRGNSSTERC